MKIKNLRAIYFTVAILFLADSQAVGVLEFNDGLIHDIDYAIGEEVRVDWLTPDMYTTVNLLPGGSISNDLWGYGSSRLNIRGGIIDAYIWGRESSQVNISGGEIHGFYCEDFSQAVISDGLISNILASRGSSQVNISGGSIDTLFSYDSSQVNISGGSIGNSTNYFSLYSYNSSQINISGGTLVSGLSSLGPGNVVNISGGSIGGFLLNWVDSEVNIYGGSIAGYIDNNYTGQVNIYGGSIGGNLYLDEQSTITIFGSDFAVDQQSFGYGEITSILGGHSGNEPARLLTSTLASGEPINNLFHIGYDARIILVPEPATITLFGLGILILRKRRLNKRLS